MVLLKLLLEEGLKAKCQRTKLQKVKGAIF